MLALLSGMGLPQSSTFAPQVDLLYDFIYWISLISFIGIVGALVYFIFKYHRKRSDSENTPYIEGHPLLEGSVMFGLFVIVMVIFYWGWMDYKKMLTPPPNSLEINITGRQWMWEFEYQNGHKMLNEVVIPKGLPVKFMMTSSDVLHSFFVPDFRIKQDLVPGAYTKLWVNPTELGEYQVMCAEYCGTSHSAMLAKVKVVEPEEYEKWQKKWEWEKRLGVSSVEATPSKPSATESPVERGQKLFTAKGCNACHTITGAALVGPSVKGIFGHEVELENGKKVTADENYIRESIMDPALKLVKGFQPVMPTFKGTLSDDEINSLVIYIKSLGK